MNKKIHKIIACSIIASTLLVSSSFADKVDETIKTVPVRTASTFREAELSRVASKVMLSIANAREDIYRKDTTRAKEALQKALGQIDAIDDFRPTKVIIDHIKVAKKHLDYESTQEVGQDLIPIAYDINQLTMSMPTENAQKHLKSAKKSISEGDKKGAKKELTALQQAVSVTGLFLPVDETKANIYKALQALNMSNLKQADTVLKKAENGLVIMSVTSVRPIARAKKSFYRAMVDYSHGEYAKSKEDLHKSELWLDKAMHSSDAKVKDEAKKLKEKTSSLKTHLSKDTTNAKAKLHALWEQSKALSERDLHSMSSRYNRSKKQVELKNDLLDAKLHLEYAKTRQFIYDRKEGVKKELEKSKMSLRKASQYADAKTAKSIKDIEDGINDIEKDTDKTGDTVKAKYEENKMEIDKIIYYL